MKFNYACAGTTFFREMACQQEPVKFGFTDLWILFLGFDEYKTGGERFDIASTNTSIRRGGLPLMEKGA